MNAGSAVAFPRVERPRASILIAAFGAERFERCLRSLAEGLRGGPPAEVIAVLNGRGLNGVADAADGLRVIDPPVNLGFPAACNLARSVASGEYIVLIQDDGRIDARWLGELLAVADAHPEAGLVGSVTLWPGGERIMQAGQVVFADGSLLEVAAGEPPSAVDGRDAFAVDTLSSHGMLVRAGTWDAVGGLDETFFPLYMVDLTLSRQVWTRGESVLCAPRARAEHTRNASTPRRFREFLLRRHCRIWLERWSDGLVEMEPRGDDDGESLQRALARADAAWRRAQPGPPASGRPTPAYDPDGGEQQRLQAGIRFAARALEVREAFAETLAQRLDELEPALAEAGAYAVHLSAELDAMRAWQSEVEAELADLRRRAQTLAAIEAGGWWRLRARLLPLMRWAARVRRR